ncbi:magnesium transporter [Mycetocola lacteus]|uniref:Magnesium transporter MgtE n=1 Tax=Mycetocola lacteus TaxID=76637 RepID=A0A3L7AJ87_9MICO|nr:magnesium transporter [Mycetocola lacteus]RLP80287.1 magnesium transporter [Mycetocola lacteus]
MGQDIDIDLTREGALAEADLPLAAAKLARMSTSEVTSTLWRCSLKRSAVLFRLLSKERALEVFERFEPAHQADLVRALRDEDVTGLFAGLDPDDRVSLLDEVPAVLAKRLLSDLTPHERALTTLMLGYPARSVGRRMSPEYVRAHPEFTAGRVLETVRHRATEAETIYMIPVTDGQKRLVGVVSLREILAAPEDARVSDLMQTPELATVSDDAEQVARRCSEANLLAMPIVDSEKRLVGILTIDDAHQILRDAEDEDIARAGGAEPLRRPYLSTSAFKIARARVVWLLVLAVSALLTVQVLGIFEATLEQKVVLALFIPLLTGTGGNTGSQAATTITRALAMGEVTSKDVGRVLLREFRVGTTLGLLLGILGFTLASLVYDVPTGLVIGSTLLCVCAMAATVGGAMPLIAKAIRVDPAVFSTPFITTFCDATGLLIYFSLAKVILGI